MTLAHTNLNKTRDWTNTDIQQVHNKYKRFITTAGTKAKKVYTAVVHSVRQFGPVAEEPTRCNAVRGQCCQSREVVRMEQRGSVWTWDFTYRLSVFCVTFWGMWSIQRPRLVKKKLFMVFFGVVCMWVFLIIMEFGNDGKCRRKVSE